jgi:hypothetical protein
MPIAYAMRLCQVDSFERATGRAGSEFSGILAFTARESREPNGSTTPFMDENHK